MTDIQQETQQAALVGTDPTLVPELLGFSPQMLLDDIISAAADAILQCLQAMEPFMQRWADARVAKVGEQWDGLEAVEQGLVSFSTLLESHTDIAFDFFEAWSLRNIFAVPPDLPLVAPHHKNLNLSTNAEKETELITEIEELRRKLENRRLKRLYLKAVRISHAGLARSHRGVERLSYLSDTSTVSALECLPSQVVELFESAASMPHLDPSVTGAPPLPDPSKRLWETGKTGYLNWAVGQLIAKSKEQSPRTGGSTIVGNAIEQTNSIGQTKDVKALAEVLDDEEERAREGEDDGMDLS